MAFNGNMLKLARQLRRMSQDDLVSRVGGQLTQGTLSKIERGRVQPSDELAAEFAAALNLRSSFFEEASYLRQPPVSYHRKRTKLQAKDREAIHGRSELIRIALGKCLDAVEFDYEGPALPSFDLDQFDGDPKLAARAVRQALRIPRGPLKNLSAIVERSGVVICSFNFGTPLIDGFCQHSDGVLPPVIFMNSALPLDRYRFSLAHEVAHLVCHDVPNPDQERQANQFASELLLPSDEVHDDLRDFSLSKAMELKLYWGVSMAALVEKAWQLGRIGDSRRKNCYIEMSRRGWRQSEPVELRNFTEQATVVESVLDLHLKELGYTMDELADFVGLHADEFVQIFPVRRERPKLRIVASN